MRHVCAFLLCLVVSGLAFGQDSRADLFGGYSYVNIDTNGLSPRQSANGWEASISGNFNKWFAVEGEGSGYYKSYSATLSGVTANAKVTDYSFAGGPRINLKPVFIHALFGGDHLNATASATSGGGSVSGSGSQDGLAGLVGGGVQWRVSGPWSVRASADYVFTRHNIFGGPSVTQNNYRAGAGIVYSFGAKHASEKPVSVRPSSPPPEQPRPTYPEPASPRPAAQPAAAAGGMNAPELGVTVTVGRSPGAEITSEAPDGIAALAGLHVGNVINAVDGKPVHTPMELAAELSSRKPGDKVRIGYLISGTWQAETVLVLH
jgi:hypothetical protein